MKKIAFAFGKLLESSGIIKGVRNITVELSNRGMR